jgi:hypothetical protein
MVRRNFVAAILFLPAAIQALPAWTQDNLEFDKKQTDAVQKTQRLLEEIVIKTAPFQKPLSFVQFLTVLDQQLPRDKQISVRIDDKATDAKIADIAAAPVVLPKNPPQQSLRGLLETVLAKIKIKADYRLEGAGIVITSSERARFTSVYDISDLVENPAFLSPANFYSRTHAGVGGAGVVTVKDLQNSEPAKKAALVIRALSDAFDPAEGLAAAGGQETIKLHNGTRLIIHAAGTRQAKIAELLASFRRRGDLAVYLQVELYEVDEAFYKELKDSKRVSVEEIERQFDLQAESKEPTLFDRLKKQKLIVAGEKTKLQLGCETVVAATHQALTFLPSPDLVHRPDRTRQVVLEGVSCLAAAQVSYDRRFVRLRITEKTTAVDFVEKIKVENVMTEKTADAEVVLRKEATHTKSLEMGDGWSQLSLLQYRPRSAQEKNRWWVLCITPTIFVREEEELDRNSYWRNVLSKVVEDVLKNPKLKQARDTIGTSGDSRFALVNSPGWTWPEKLELETGGGQLTAAKREGNRLLGIRVDKRAEDVIVTLINAGGTANGEVIGGYSLRYVLWESEDGTLVKLAPYQ